MLRLPASVRLRWWTDKEEVDEKVDEEVDKKVDKQVDEKVDKNVDEKVDNKQVDEAI